MKFTDIYQQTIKLWPATIDVSDGRQVSEKGFYFSHLSAAWDKAEQKAQGEWQELMVWTIFKELHKNAKILLKEGKSELLIKSLDLTKVEETFALDLQEEGYEEMLAAYNH